MGTPVQSPVRTTFASLVDAVAALPRLTPPDRAVLVAISGIDGSGKGHTTARLEVALTTAGLRVANLNIDGWLRLPSERFDPLRPAEHFYQNGIRYDEMFEQLVLPLVRNRSIRLEACLADSTNVERWIPHTFAFDDVDIVLLEGILLFREHWMPRYDLSAWIDCTFETALERALARGQEQLPPDEVVRDYHTIYFPTQHIHFERDRPRERADLILPNDPRL